MQGVHLRKYGVQTTIDFEVYEVDGVDLRVDWVPAAADCEIMKNEGASTQCTNTATDEGSIYSIVLTATEMEHARGVLKIVDAATKVFLDKVIIIETYGHASAMHAFDLDTATQGVDIVSISGDSTAADNLELDYDGTGYTKANSTIGTCTTNTDMRGTDNAATASALSTHDGKLDLVDGIVDDILVDTGTTIPGLINSLNDISTGDVTTSVNTALDAGNTELGSVPNTSGSIRTMIQWNFTYGRNKKTVTSTTESLFKEDGTSVLGTAALTDDGTTFTKGEMG